MAEKDSEGRRVLVIDAEQFKEMVHVDYNLTLAITALFVAQCEAIGADQHKLLGQAKHLMDKNKHFKQ